MRSAINNRAFRITGECLLILVMVGLGFLNVAGSTVLRLRTKIPARPVVGTSSPSFAYAPSHKFRKRSIDRPRAPRGKAKIKNPAPVRAGGVTAYVTEIKFSALNTVSTQELPEVRYVHRATTAFLTRGPPSV